jgi:hypothetical protein
MTPNKKSESKNATETLTTAGETSTTDQLISTIPEPVKNPTKADRARGIYNEMILDPANGRNEIAARIKQELGVSQSAGQTYFYQFQRETGRVVEKPETKMDKAKPLYEKLIAEGKTRQHIIEAFVNEIDLTPAGASTYYQNLKRDAEKSKPK